MHWLTLLMTDPNACTPCRSRDAAIVFGTSQRNHIYREKTAEVSQAGPDRHGTVVDFRFAAERLTSLVRTLELTNIDEHYALQKVASFGTLIATYEKGFLLILEPYETEHATVPNPIFHTV
jgi:DNA excision repair protein ERCC-2